jgi:hypothetical protein
MGQYKFIEADEIGLEEISENLVSIKMGEEKVLIDTDTLYDLAFRFAAFLTYLENKPEPEARPRTQSELH